MDYASAKEITEAAFECYRRLNKSLLYVQENSDEASFKAYRTGVSKVLLEILLIINPILAEHPVLKPADWES